MTHAQFCCLVCGVFTTELGFYQNIYCLVGGVLLCKVIKSLKEVVTDLTWVQSAIDNSNKISHVLICVEYNTKRKSV